MYILTKKTIGNRLVTNHATKPYKTCDIINQSIVLNAKQHTVRETGGKV